MRNELSQSEKKNLKLIVVLRRNKDQIKYLKFLWICKIELREANLMVFAKLSMNVNC